MVGFAGKDAHTKPLHQMFTAVPPHYDLVNHVITWALDKRWRRQAAKACLDSQPRKMLDLCCGTGDLAILFAKLTDDGTEVTGLDYSQPMLELANKKAVGLKHKPSFVNGNADNLPFPDGYFDCVGISFAFRNLTYKNPLAQRHISEVLRVLSPSGRFVIVESSQPGNRLIRKLFHLYLRWFVYNIGVLLSGNRRAYHYLAESASRFYTPEELKEMLLTAGFSQVSYRPLMFGAAGIHVAIK